MSSLTYSLLVWVMATNPLFGCMARSRLLPFRSRPASKQEFCFDGSREARHCLRHTLDRCPSIGRRCNELRVTDKGSTWRVIYRIDRDAIVIAEVFAKKTTKTPKGVVDSCKKRLMDYDAASREGA